MNVDLFKRLCEVPGVPGREERVRALIEEEIEGLFDETEVDAMGNLICYRYPRTATAAKSRKAAKPVDGATRVMLACHMDEIGFYVKHIDSNGFLHLHPAGGFDTRNLFSRRVLVCTDKAGDLPGVMNPGGKPLHISSPEDRTKVPAAREFVVDTGLPAKQVQKSVQIGDYVVMNEPALEMGEKIVSKAIDNRYACWVGIETVRALVKANAAHKSEIVVVFTVQEEVGVRGATAAANYVQPDIGIGIDVTLACDTPGVGEADRTTAQGDGAVLSIMDGMTIAHYELVNEIEAAGKKARVKVQRSILGAGGTDTAPMQRGAGGAARVATISAGIRYIHTVTEMIDKRDADASVKLLAAWLPTVK